MILAKDLKRIIDAIPDDSAVTIDGCYDCNIESFTFDTSTGVTDLHLTEGFGLIKSSFVNALFDELKKATISC